MTGDHSHRASVLTPEEVEDIYSIPNFSDADREIHFALNEKEADLVQSRRGAVGLFLILMIGYFKAKRQFFDLSSDAASDDMQFVRTRYFPELKGRLATIPSRPTLMTLQDHFLELYGFRRWHPTLSSAALESLALSAARSTQPRYLARELLQHFERHSIVTPPYSGLQDLIGEAVSRERNRLTALLKTSLTRFIKKELESLLQADGSMYKISVLKKELNDFSYTALRDEVARRRSFEPLHAFAQRFLSSARISQESSKYYASLVTYYTVYKLARMDRLVAFLYLLCFSYHRYRQINDHLVEAFLVRVDGYTRQAGEASKEAMQQALIAGTENLKAAGEILNLFVDKTLPDSATFAAVKAKAFTYLAPERIPAVADYMRNVAFDKAAYQWQFYTSMSMTIKKNLRHLFVELEFTGRVINSPLQQAIEFLQRHLRAGRSPRQIDPKTFPLT